MKRLWHTWCERIDAMALRERAIVFFAAALVLVFLPYALLLRPALHEQQQLARSLAQKQSETGTLQEEAQRLLGTRSQDPDAALRAELDDLKQRSAAVGAALAAKSRELVPPGRIPGLLAEMLRRDNRLELVDLRLIPAAPLFGEKDSGPQAIAAARAGLQVYRHGVELTVRGGYFDLQRYLSDLERLPLRMFWGELDVAATDYPTVTMKLTVYTLGLDRSWIVV